MDAISSSIEAVEAAEKYFEYKKRFHFLNSFLTNLAGHSLDRKLVFKLSDQKKKRDKVLVYENGLIQEGMGISISNERNISFGIIQAEKAIGEDIKPEYLSSYIGDSGNLVHEFDTHIVEYRNSDLAIVTQKRN